MLGRKKIPEPSNFNNAELRLQVVLREAEFMHAKEYK